jgi:hypothetical protein
VITPNNWYGREAALVELRALSWAVSSLIDVMTKPGSSEREIAKNAQLGIRHRVEYLHDSFEKLLDAKIAGAVAEKLTP